MNYRHIYHAGNICDVVKHVTLSVLLDALAQKPAPYMVLDTHAGCGLYDLEDPAARKTAEADAGIRKIGQGPLPDSFRQVLIAANAAGPLRFYPGSPHLIAAMLRPADRLIACELHPADAASLRRNLKRFPQAQIHERDGYAALRAFLPPPEKRGLVFIDPPFEQPGEFDKLAAAVTEAHRRWPTGQYAIWYPIKDGPATWRFQEKMAASGIRKQLLLEFIYDDEASAGLHGSGMLVINPPWQLSETMKKTYAALHQNLNRAVQETKITWLAPEAQ